MLCLSQTEASLDVVYDEYCQAVRNGCYDVAAKDAVIIVRQDKSGLFAHEIYEDDPPLVAHILQKDYPNEKLSAEVRKYIKSHVREILKRISTGS